jgi:hypothetical protein
MPTKKSLKMYVLVRSDLDTTYRGVQGIHAVAAFYERGNSTNWHNSTVVQLAVRNEQDLKQWMWKLDTQKKNYTSFSEPDLGDQITSIACVDTGEIFKNLPLSRN